MPYTPDILAAGLDVIFCGINPATTAAADGHNFSNRSNRFWRVLHLAGFTPRQLEPEEESQLILYGCGVTAVVARATRTAAQVSRQDYLAALPEFEEKVRKHAPRVLAFLGKAAYA